MLCHNTIRELTKKRSDIPILLRFYLSCAVIQAQAQTGEGGIIQSCALALGSDPAVAGL